MNIVLIGYRGVGKTTIAGELAKRLRRPYLSTDILIEKKVGKPLNTLIKQKGWDFFRDVEHSVVAELPLGGYIIDTGGGVVLHKVHGERLRTNSIVFWLKENLDVVAQRLKKSKRPSLFNRVVLSSYEIKKTFAERKPLYKKAADYAIHCHSRSISEIVDAILMRVHHHIKALIFDYGEVLLHYKDEIFIQELASLFRVPFTTMHPVFYQCSSPLQKGLITEESFFKNLSKKCGVILPPVNVRAFLKEEFIRNSSWNGEMVALLQRVHQRYKVALLSNIEPTHRDVTLEDPQFKRIAPLFSSTIFSCDVGMRKPDKKIYALALKKLRLSPRQCIFIDDREVNLVPSRDLGMHTILFKDHQHFCTDLKTFFVDY